MRLSSLLALAAVVGVLSTLAITAQAQEPPADPGLILRGAYIDTENASQPRATALVVEAGRIVYVGDDLGAQAFRRAGTREIDLQRRMVLPGFHDAHSHPMSGAMKLLRCALGDARSERAVYSSIRRCASSDTTHAWFLGSGWTTKMFGAAGPSLTKLDALVPDRPAFVTTEDGFTAWVNSRALAIAGIDAEHAQGDDGGVHRDASGRATGVLEGSAADRVRHLVPRPDAAEYREALKRSSAIANRFGITSVFDASVSADMLEAYRAADAAGELTLRVVAAQRVDMHRGLDQVDEFVARRDRAKGRRLRADAAKIFLDGEIDQHTAALLEPYADSPDARGDLFAESEASLQTIVRRLDEEGFLIHLHAMGDRAVRAGLDAIEAAARSNGARDRRDQVAHIAVASDTDIARFASLGVGANFQPMWFRSDDPALAGIKTALGPVRSASLYPIESIARAGGRILASSDWPSTSMNPLDAIEAAVTREGSNARDRSTLAAMLASYTKEASWFAREEEQTGTIEVGKSADLVVLERNLFETKPRDLHKVRVLLTMIDGRPVYADPSFALRKLSQSNPSAKTRSVDVASTATPTSRNTP